jgi:prepilin-type processing-associated H-X9-DG protein
MSHYVGNMGASFKRCTLGSRDPPRVWPENSYTHYNNTCNDDPAPGTQDPPVVSNPVPSGGVAVNGAIFPLSDLSLGKITDGTSNTIMFGEFSWDAGPQEPWIVGSTSQNQGNPISSAHGVVYNAKNIKYLPNERPFVYPEGAQYPAGKMGAYSTNASLGSNHPGGVHVVMCDGSARFIIDEIDLEKVYKPMASRDAGEVYVLPQ